MTEEEHNEHEDAKALKAQFEAIVTEEFGTPGRTSLDIAKEIVALEEKEYNIKNSFEMERAKRDFYLQEEKELKAKLDKMRQQRYEVESVLKKGEQEATQFRTEIEKLRREASRLKSHEIANKEFADAAKRFLDECMTRPWFNAALDHQIHGAQSLAFAKRGFLGDYMGLGKTLTSLIWADFVKAHRILVLAPKETCYSFIKEIGKWADDRIVLNFIAQPKRIRDAQFMSADISQKAGVLDQFIIVANLETWRRDKQFIADIIAMKPDCVIIDESHTIKNKKSNAFAGIAEIVYAHNSCISCGESSFAFQHRINEEISTYRVQPYFKCNSCGHGTFNEIDTCSVKNVLCMTGTPILNKPQELWPILYLIDKATYPKEDDFLIDFCWLDPWTKRYKFQHGGIARLAKKIGNSFVMRDYESAGIKIPEQQVHEYYLDFNAETAPEQWRAYQILANHYMILLEEDQGAFVKHKLAIMTRSRQMATWPEGIVLKDLDGTIKYRCNVKQSLKLEFAEQKIRELLATGERVILFSKFTAPLEELHNRLNDCLIDEDSDKRIRSAILNGDTPQHLKDQIRYDFDKSTRQNRNGKYKWDLLLCNYQVGGQSATFTEAIHTVILDEEWNPGKRDQAYGRTHRIGQDRETIVHLIKLRNDNVEIIDDFMSNLISEKEETTVGFEKATKESTEKLMEILRKTVKGK